jgi:hypothetical protein
LGGSGLQYAAWHCHKAATRLLMGKLRLFDR